VETQAEPRSTEELHILMKGPVLRLLYGDHRGPHPGTREDVEKKRGRKKVLPF